MHFEIRMLIFFHTIKKKMFSSFMMLPTDFYVDSEKYVTQSGTGT